MPSLPAFFSARTVSSGFTPKVRLSKIVSRPPIAAAIANEMAIVRTRSRALIVSFIDVPI